MHKFLRGAFAACALALPLLASAASPPKPFSADYEVRRNDQRIGTGQVSLQHHADGTFESGGQPYGRNDGRWVYRDGTRRLGLDSDLGPDNDSVWEVTLRGDVMEWRGVGSDYARRFRITSRRVR